MRTRLLHLTFPAAAVLAVLPLTVGAQQSGYPGGAAYPFGTPASKSASHSHFRLILA